MKLSYDPEANALYIELRDVAAANSRDLDEGVTVDLDADGQIIGLEILDARERLGGDPLANISIERLTSAPAEAAVSG